MSPDTTNTSLSFLGPEMLGAILPDVICDGPFCMMKSSLSGYSMVNWVTVL